MRGLLYNFGMKIFVSNILSGFSSISLSCSLINVCSQGELNKAVTKNDVQNDGEKTDPKSSPNSSKHHTLLLQVHIGTEDFCFQLNSEEQFGLLGFIHFDFGGLICKQ